jgi:hypothetical protein
MALDGRSSPYARWGELGELFLAGCARFHLLHNDRLVKILYYSKLLDNLLNREYLTNSVIR